MRNFKLKEVKTLEVDRREAANDEPYAQDILPKAELSELGLNKTPIALDILRLLTSDRLTLRY